ncbi:cupin domain-containing protein [Marinobacter xestospongiae]|uniref:Cupin domain-containing protein n=1 Tax=Marinobacter xestospongiae TaxID=994319 RepID=A0ABU3VZ81_9GAMM|nr:cupin domain-containing protein [Marinobacter xestospongiae]MDV2079554.1 cupin domain-containing protein [Marinobacter xestospongiae]
MTRLLPLTLLLCASTAWSDAPFSREDKMLQPLPEHHTAGYIKSQRIEMAVGTTAPAHQHPVPTFGVVNQGQVEFQLQGQAPVILRAGDTFYEPPHTTVLKFGAHGEQRAAFTVFYLLDSEGDDTVSLL